MDTVEIERTIKVLEFRLHEDPENPLILNKLAELYYQMGNFDTRAREVYEKIIQINPREVKYQKALSISLLLEQISQIPLEIRELSEVDRRVIRHNIEHLEMMAGRQPDNVTIRQALANLLLFTDEMDKAIEHYKICLKLGGLKGDSVKAFFQYIYSHTAHVDTTHLIFFVELFRKTNEMKMALNLLLDLYKKGERTSYVREMLTELLQHFIEQFHKEQTEENKLLRNEYLRLLTDLYLERNELLNALQTLSQVDLTKITDFSTVKRVARMLIKYGDFRGSFDLLARIPVDDEAKQIINEIVLHMEKRGELDTATYLLQFINQNDITIKEISENRWRQLETRAEIGLANLYFKKKQYQQAFEKYLSAIKRGYHDIDEFSEQLDYLISTLQTVDIDLLKLIGKTYLADKNYYKAAEYYNSVLEKSPEDTESRQNLREIYNYILEKAPFSGELRIKSGDLFFLEGDYESALGEYRQAIEFPLTSIKANKRLADIYFKTGSIQLALEKYKELPVDENDLPQIYNIMQILINNEQNKAAQEAADLIMTIRPDYRDTSTMLDMLQQKEREYLVSSETNEEIQQLIGEHSLGRYHLANKIATGGMGVIYKVYDKKLNKNAAMKILRDELSSSDRALERFFREARIAASINHKNIVEIYDYNISHQSGHSYISMEYIDGKSLRQIIEEKFMYSPEPSDKYMAQIFYYLQQVCSALDATHKKGIIHRDIKPDNIMITRDDVVKITDFGIVHIEKATLTPTGALIGTPRYMSPEQVRGAKIDGRADIYALGIVMYESLLGSPPFIAGDIAYQQVNVEPPTPSEIMSSIPESVNTLIIRTLHKKPEDRFQNAGEMIPYIINIIEALGGYEPATGSQTTDGDFMPSPLESDLDL